MAAMDKVMREHRLQAQDIERVTALVSTNTLHHCGWAYEAANVQGVLAAQMNLRYGIAVMALEREATVKQFTQEKLRDAAILAFIQRIEVAVNPPYDESGGKYRVACKLRVRCRDGAEHESEVLYRNGSIEDPMSTSELDYKFITLATSALRESTARKIADAVAHIDNDGARELLRLLAAPVNT
jgi:2-methylcitrate dehydratase PrpD